MARALFVCLLIMACAAQPARHGNAALRVSAFVVQATANELDIVGVGLDDTVVTHLHFRTGMVTPEGWDVATVGRELRLEIMGTAYPPFASAGLAPLTLPLTGDPYLNTFVHDPFVAPILSRWGLVFADHVRAGPQELEYAQCTSTPDVPGPYYPPCTINNVTYGPLSACIDFWGFSGDNQVWDQKIVCADPALTRAERLCTVPYAPTPCGTAGPNGCASCGSAGNAGLTRCSGDTCMFTLVGSSGGGGHCGFADCAIACSSDADCCNCGGYCGSDGLCVY